MYLDSLDYLLISKFFYRKMCFFRISSNKDLDFVKPRTKEVALSSY